MGMTKKAAAEALRNHDLTKAKDSGDGKLRLEDEELREIAKAYAANKVQADEIDALQKDLKRKIIDVAIRKRLVAERAGRFYSTAQIELDGEGQKLQVIWPDRYNTIDVSYRSLLKQMFGRHYQDLFSDSADIKIDPDVTVDELEKALGARAFESLKRFMSFTPKLKLNKGFGETRAELRASFDADKNKAIDDVVANVTYSPTVKVVQTKKR